MVRLLAKFGLLALICAAYIGSPFYTAWSIREAARNGNAAYLETAIDWPQVRVTLIPSLTKMAVDDVTGDANAGMWQRFKAYVGQSAVSSAVENAVTPEGLPRLFAMRKAYRDYVAGQPDDATLPTTERMRRTWARVKRAEFTSFTTFEVDMTDKLDDHRLIHARLELKPLGWTLTGLKLTNLTSASGEPLRFAEIGDGVTVPSTNFWDAAKTAAQPDR